jgi:hypothetical protein
MMALQKVLVRQFTVRGKRYSAAAATLYLQDNGSPPRCWKTMVGTSI